MAFWELMPTVDHLVPVARGGVDAEENWVTTSMLLNSAKSNWRLEDIGWEQFPAGDLNDWDGMSRWFVDYMDRHSDYQSHSFLRDWHRATLRLLRA